MLLLLKVGVCTLIHTSPRCCQLNRDMHHGQMATAKIACVDTGDSRYCAMYLTENDHIYLRPVKGSGLMITNPEGLAAFVSDPTNKPIVDLLTVPYEVWVTALPR